MSLSYIPLLSGGPSSAHEMDSDKSPADVGGEPSVTSVTDPNKIQPESHPADSQVLKRITDRDLESKLPKATIPLTERNLTEFFNPDYNDEHDAFLKVQGPRKISIPEWLSVLPRVGSS
jgi:hypothetical protein